MMRKFLLVTAAMLMCLLLLFSSAAGQWRGGPGAAAAGSVALQPERLPVITHYRLGPLLGRGGMGSVFEAHDLLLGEAHKLFEQP